MGKTKKEWLTGLILNMRLNDSIVQRWKSIYQESQQKWKTEVLELLKGELENKGVSILSSSLMFVNDNEFHYLLICESSDGAYIEIRIQNKKGFMVSVDYNENPFYWPTAPFSVRDRKNYTIQHLIDWLETKPWKQ